jgi:hypothetical protein
MRVFSNITLIGIDCVDLKRLQLAADISTKEITFGAVKLLTSIKSDDPRVIQIPPIKSKKAYSEFIIKKLDKYIDTEFALIFQYDGFILNPDAWTDEFLKYDYIGAPWYHLGDLRVGNGGFSLRSKKLIHWFANNWHRVKARIDPEDVFISRFARPCLEKEGMVFAPESIATIFSIEGSRRSVVWKGEFGFHGIKYTDISRWLEMYPEYKNQLRYTLDDYATLMKKYPVYDGTVHTLFFCKDEMENYRNLAQNLKQYEIRIARDKHDDFGEIKIGNTIVFKRTGVSLKDVPVPAFERKVIKIERFNTFCELHHTYPKLYVAFPIGNIAKWKRLFIRFFGNFAYPKKQPYIVFWFN